MSYTLSYTLRKDRVNEDGKCPIYIRYTHKRMWTNIPLRYSIDPIFWIDNKEENKISKKYPNYNLLRTKMLEIETNIREVIETFHKKTNSYPKNVLIKELLQKGKKTKEIKQPIKKTEVSLESLYNQFIEFKKKELVEQSTLNIYKYTWDKWESFITSTKQRNLSDLNENCLNDFKTFLLNQGLQKNTIGKYTKTLKTFLNYLYLKLELPVPISYKRTKVDRESKRDFEVLTKSELEILKKEVFFSRYFPEESGKNLSEKQKLVGRIMIFLCSTGLSFVDYDRVTINDLFIETDKLTGEKYLNLKITRQKIKSTEDCVIPVLDMTIDLIFEMMDLPHQVIEHNKSEPLPLQTKMKVFERIIEQRKRGININEYYPRIFPKITSQEFNREIKELLKVIGIDNMITRKKLIKNKVETEYFPKYKLVSSHTGRRTYITLCLESGISPHILMETTGHKKIGTLLRYNRKSDITINKEFRSKINLQN